MQNKEISLNACVLKNEIYRSVVKLKSIIHLAYEISTCISKLLIDI